MDSPPGSNVSAVCWSTALMFLVGLPIRASGACPHPSLVNIFSSNCNGYSIYDKTERGGRNEVIDNKARIYNYLGSQSCQVNTKSD